MHSEGRDRSGSGQWFAAERIVVDMTDGTCLKPNENS
jgi:hypothetical protein